MPEVKGYEMVKYKCPLIADIGELLGTTEEVRDTTFLACTTRRVGKHTCTFLCTLFSAP